MSKVRCSHGQIWYTACQQCGEDPYAERVVDVDVLVSVATHVPFISVQMTSEQADDPVARDRIIRAAMPAYVAFTPETWRGRRPYDDMPVA